jgi:hypothetical protein
MAAHRNMLIAKLTEKVVCHRLGFVGEGEAVTKEAISRYVRMFDGQSLASLRALFCLDCDLATMMEDALVEHGGAEALDQQGDTTNAQT